MVWDDAMQEPTAADHGDVLYNIGINLLQTAALFLRALLSLTSSVCVYNSVSVRLKPFP